MKQFKYRDRHDFYNETGFFPDTDVIVDGIFEKWLENHRIKITIGDCTLDLEWNAEIADAIWSVLEKIEGYYTEA